MVLGALFTGACSAEVSAVKPMQDNKDQGLEIAMVVKDEYHKQYVNSLDGVARFEEDSGISAFQVGPQEIDAAMQAQLVEGLIEQKVDAICIIPIDSITLEPALAKAMDAGIPVFTQEATTQQNKVYDLEMFRPEVYGAALMDALAEQMGEGGEYCITVSYMSNTSHNHWADSAVARQLEAYPEMRLLDGDDARVETEDNVQRAYEKAKEIIKKHPQLKGFLCMASNDIEGVSKAVEELGRSRRIVVTGSGIPSSAEKYLKSGTLKEFYTWDSAAAVYALLTMANRSLHGEAITNRTNLGAPGFECILSDAEGKGVFFGEGFTKVNEENIDSLGFYY
ncbi:MAG: substrate-binding domain-containing protein [Clostridiales Family XIII bacterium]|jgi:simple sugar transport system substrate-binding protein|nr:substrate-binding domain-containing protein [Clostridiales Family XIII bacterium]